MISEKLKAMLEDAGIPPAEHAELATASMRETADIILDYPPVSPPPADGSLSLRALAPGLGEAGLPPQAMPAGWTSLRVLALAARVLELRRSALPHDDAQLANVDLQNAQARTALVLHLLSSISKSISETQMEILSRMKD